MLFSEYFKINTDEDDEWFNPILHQDTLLFIDPFLVFKSTDGLFGDSYPEIMDFFNLVFQLVAQAGGNTNHPSYKKAVNLLTFHEVNEICLGYSPSREGAGPGIGLAKSMADTIRDCIQHGVKNVRHFEEIGLFHPRIGRDLISDMTANLLKVKLVAYTQEICTQKNIPMSEVTLANGYFDEKFLRWEATKVALPINKFKGRGILLVPKRFLKEIPEINKDNFRDAIEGNESLRNDLNFEVGKNIDKETLARIARENYDLVNEYIDDVENRQARPYNILEDYQLRYKWYQIARDLINSTPLSIDNPNDEAEFVKRVRNIAQYFVDFIELHSGYKLLWDDKNTKPKSELAVQLLFHGIVHQHCLANNIDLSREVNQGRGPVDFKFSSGFRKKVLLEAKLANNTKFWHGLREQLPLYLRADCSKNGFFLVIAYRQEDFERIKAIREEVAKVNSELGLNISAIVVDATCNKPSASHL